jgi:hypothetical protein
MELGHYVDVSDVWVNFRETRLKITSVLTRVYKG